MYNNLDTIVDLKIYMIGFDPWPYLNMITTEC